MNPLAQPEVRVKRDRRHLRQVRANRFLVEQYIILDAQKLSHLDLKEVFRVLSARKLADRRHFTDQVGQGPFEVLIAKALAQNAPVPLHFLYFAVASRSAAKDQLLAVAEPAQAPDPAKATRGRSALAACADAGQPSHELRDRHSGAKIANPNRPLGVVEGNSNVCLWVRFRACRPSVIYGIGCVLDIFPEDRQGFGIHGPREEFENVLADNDFVIDWLRRLAQRAKLNAVHRKFQVAPLSDCFAKPCILDEFVGRNSRDH